MTTLKNIRVVEVTYNWPAEVFIDRHIEAVQKVMPGLIVVARHSNPNYSASASVINHTSQYGRIMPNFDHLTIVGKLGSLRYLAAYPKAICSGIRLRDKVLLAYFAALRPDLIHFHTLDLAQEMGWIPEELGIPFTLSLRGSDIQVAPLRSPEAMAAAQHALNRAAAVHAISTRLAELAKNEFAYQREPQIIYTTVPLPHTLPMREERHVGNSLHLMSVGRLVWHKGFPDLLLAFAMLLRDGLQVELTIIGSGPEEKRLLAYAGRLGVTEHLRLVGKMSYENIQKIFSESNVYIQSSIAEGFGNSLAEAMANGCPVFATEVCGAKEVIQDMETGMLLTPLQPEAWVDKIKMALDPQFLEHLRVQAYQTACEKFSSQGHAQSFDNFFHSAGRKDTHNNLKAYNNHPLQSTQSSTESNFNKGIIVWGEWSWENKTDRILRGILQIAPSFPDLAWYLVGGGLQADELRYIAHTFGKNLAIHFIPIHVKEIADPAVRQIWMDRSQGWIDLQGIPAWVIDFQKISPWEEDQWIQMNLSKMAMEAITEKESR